MPPRGVRKGTKRAREYQHIKVEREAARCLGEEGRGDRGADRQQGSGVCGRVPDPVQGLAAGKSPVRGGGQRSGTNRPKGRTREQLYEEAKRMNVPGRSSMNKAQLQRAVDRRK